MDILSKLEQEKEMADKNQSEIEQNEDKNDNSSSKKGKANKALKLKDIKSMDVLLEAIKQGGIEGGRKKRISLEMTDKDKVVIPLTGLQPDELVRLLLDDFYSKPEVKKLINQNLK